MTLKILRATHHGKIAEIARDLQTSQITKNLLQPQVHTNQEELLDIVEALK